MRWMLGFLQLNRVRNYLFFNSFFIPLKQSLSPLSEGLEHERVQLLNRIDGDIKDLNKEEATEITEAANDILEGEEQEALREYEETPDEAIEALASSVRDRFSNLT